MILPTKHLPEDRALLTVASVAWSLLSEPRTVSSLWDGFTGDDTGVGASLSFDWFVLALDLLYALGSIDLADGQVLSRR